MKSVLIIAILVFGATVGSAATQGRTQRPVKNPPQYPNIITPEGKTNSPKPGSTPETAEAPSVTPEFVKALETLTGELRHLVQEIRAMNVRQQAQLDMLKLTRGDGLLANYERDLKAVTEVRDRLDREEQALTDALRPEAIAARASQVGTIDRDATSRQIKQDLEIQRLAVQTEKAKVQVREAELNQIVGALRSSNDDTERRLLLVEDALRHMTAPQPAPEEKKP